VKLPENIEIFRNLPGKFEIFWSRIHDPQISNQIDVTVCIVILLQFSMTKKVFWDRRRATAADQNWPARRRRHHDVGARLCIKQYLRPHVSTAKPVVC